MRGYVKLFSSVLSSSVWSESPETRCVWVAMMAMCDTDGVVEASVPGLARIANVPLDACQRALETFQAPDPYSRTTDNEGRRIEAVPGGWRLLNYERYRERAQDKDGSRAPYMREYRAAKNKAATEETTPTDGNALQSGVTRNHENTDQSKKLSSVVTRNTDERRETTEERLTELQQPRAPAREGPPPDDGPPPTLNPLVDAPKLIAEGYEHLRRIGELLPLLELPDEDPTETLAKASTGYGKLAGARKVSLEAIARSPDHLAQTVCDLRERRRKLEAQLSAKEAAARGPSRADPRAQELVERIGKRLRSANRPNVWTDASWSVWWRPLVGIAVAGGALRVQVPAPRFLVQLGQAQVSEVIADAMRAEGLGHLRLELIVAECEEVA